MKIPFQTPEQIAYLEELELSLINQHLEKEDIEEIKQKITKRWKKNDKDPLDLEYLAPITFLLESLQNYCDESSIHFSVKSFFNKILVDKSYFHNYMIICALDFANKKDEFEAFKKCLKLIGFKEKDFLRLEHSEFAFSFILSTEDVLKQFKSYAGSFQKQIVLRYKLVQILKHHLKESNIEFEKLDQNLKSYPDCNNLMSSFIRFKSSTSAASHEPLLKISDWLHRNDRVLFSINCTSDLAGDLDIFNLNEEKINHLFNKITHDPLLDEIEKVLVQTKNEQGSLEFQRLINESKSKKFSNFIKSIVASEPSKEKPIPTRTLTKKEKFRK